MEDDRKVQVRESNYEQRTERVLHNVRVERQLSDGRGETSKILTKHLSTDFLAPRLLVIQNAVRGGEHNDTKLHVT